MNTFSEALACFSSLPSGVEEQLHAYAEQLLFYNQKLNLIARTDERHVLNRHIAHCLRLAKRGFPPRCIVVDWGTGGGLPLLPLAVLFPEVSFVGVDAVEKKVLAVRQMARLLNLKNVDVVAGRAETLDIPHTHSVSRATAPLVDLWTWHLRGARHSDITEHEWPAGLICLKGGTLGEEVAALEARHAVRLHAEAVGFSDPYFEAKKVVMVTER